MYACACCHGEKKFAAVPLFPFSFATKCRLGLGEQGQGDSTFVIRLTHAEWMCINKIVPMKHVMCSYRFVQYLLVLHMHFLAVSRLQVQAHLDTFSISWTAQKKCFTELIKWPNKSIANSYGAILSCVTLRGECFCLSILVKCPVQMLIITCLLFIFHFCDGALPAQAFVEMSQARPSTP